ncbi:MAG: hypothetical protein RMN24_00055, partial [Anaerolineae bacterium]|nr:hypothetical protein [Anaerolineae bacterium]
MSAGKPTSTEFEWVFGEEAWRHPPQDTTAGRPSARVRWRPMVRFIGPLLLVVVIAGIVIWQQVVVGAKRLQQDIEATVALEEAAWATRDADAVRVLLDPEAPREWRLRLQREARRGVVPPPVVEVLPVRLRDNLAVAPVLVRDPTGHLLREHRFYRLTGMGWRRTYPPATFWGSRQELNTTHFRFVYHEADADAVLALAAEIETLYTGMVRDFGLEAAAAGRTFVVEIVPEDEPTQYLVGRDWLRMGSPWLVRASADFTPRDILARRVGDWVAAQLIYRRGNLNVMAAPALRLILYCLSQHAARSWAPVDPIWDETRRQYLRRAVAAELWLPPSRATVFPLAAGGWQERSYQCSTVGEFIVEAYGST